MFSTNQHKCANIARSRLPVATPSTGLNVTTLGNYAMLRLHGITYPCAYFYAQTHFRCGAHACVLRAEYKTVLFLIGYSFRNCNIKFQTEHLIYCNFPNMHFFFSDKREFMGDYDVEMFFLNDTAVYII